MDVERPVTSPAPDAAGTQRGARLLDWARARLRQELGGAKAEPPAEPWCKEAAATFVTLRWPDGRLQGCIGSLSPRRSLVDDVGSNAVAAALHDPRAGALSLDEIDELVVEVSILSPLEPIPSADEREALEAIEVGKHGVVLEIGDRRTTFLPSMWPRLATKSEFLRELKVKAGMARDAWPEGIRAYRYTVEKHEDGPE